MFFTLGRHKDNRLPCHARLGSMWLSHDQGWYPTDHGFIKGYTDNFLEFVLNGQDIVVTHDQYRSCPLWWDHDTKTLTNLLGQGERIWADKSVTISSDTLLLETQHILPDINTPTLTVDQAVDKIANVLVNKINFFDKNFAGRSKKLFVTGGIDTVLLLALIKHCNVNCDILDYEYFEYDYFTNLNLQQLCDQHWAYKQIHHWQNPTVLVTGACGDEFLMRGPHTLAMWAAWHNIDVETLLNTRPGYHVGYYLMPKNLKVFRDFYNQRIQLKEQYPTYQGLVEQILNVNANDHQHWHLGNTLTFTPFKDLALTEIMLRLDPSDLIEQIIDASINRELIKKFHPACIDLLSTTKNTNNREFLTGLAKI